MEAEFVAATRASQVGSGGWPPEICDVLNRLPPHLLQGTDAQVVDTVDALMDDLYRRRLLSCPGHRWLPRPPESIRGHLTGLFEQGCIRRDPVSRRWTWHDVTSYFFIG